MILSNFRSNTKILVLRLLAGLAIGNLKKFKKQLHNLHIANEGISEESINRMVARDAQDRANEVRDLLYKLRMEKGKSKTPVIEKEILYS